MRILYLSYYYSPDITAAAFRSTDFIEFLEEKNIENRVITTYPHKANKIDHIDESNNKYIKRVRLAKMKNKGLVSYLLHYFSFIPKALFVATKWYFKGWRPSAIFISSPPLFIGIVGLFLKWLYGAKLILEIRDIWPDSAVAAGQISRSGRAYKLARRLEKYLYKTSDGIICVSNRMKEYLSEYTSKPICVAYNGPREASILQVGNMSPEDKSEKKTKLKLAYAGNLGLLQGLNFLLEALYELKKANNLRYDWQLEIFGTGTLEDDLIKKTDELNLGKSVIFHGALPKEELNLHLSLVDVFFLGLVKDEVLEKTIPSKLFDYLSFGKPVLAALSGEGKEILEQNSANLVVEECRTEPILKGLLYIDENYSILVKNANENIEILKNRFTREQNNDRILNYIAPIIS